MRRIAAVITALIVTSCASSSVIPLTQDTLRISSEAELECGVSSVQKIAFQQAAIETIRRGYDRFIVIGDDHSRDIGVAGSTPAVAQTTGSTFGGGFNATTTYSGGSPLIYGWNTQGLVVKMFKEDDPAARNALVARNELGANWAELIKKEVKTCLD